MNFDVQFDMEPMTLKAELGEMVEVPNHDAEDDIVDRSIAGAYRNSRAMQVGAYAFQGCASLTSVDFLLAKNIGVYAFSGCNNLVSADFSVVTQIGVYAFRYCTALTALILRSTDKVCTLSAQSAFQGASIASGTGYIYVPDDLVENYKTATNWSTYADQIKPLSELEE